MINKNLQFFFNTFYPILKMLTFDQFMVEARFFIEHQNSVEALAKVARAAAILASPSILRWVAYIFFDF